MPFSNPMFHLAPTPGAPKVASNLLDAPAPAGISAWLNYERDADFDVIASRAEIPLRDGTILVGTLYRPARDGAPAEGRFPGVVSEFTPYAFYEDPTAREYLAERGYVVLVCNVRGSGESEGEFESWFPELEAQDNYDLIEWLAAQDFCDGSVGQIGTSYGSITAYRAAALRPPHLKAIVPIASPTDIYAEWVRPGGVPTIAGSWWATGGPTVSAHGHASALRSFQDHPLDDEHWRQVATTNKIADAEVPALHIGGYYDIFKNGGFDALEQRPDKTWLFYGPWIHFVPLAVPGKPTMSAGAFPAQAVSYGTILQWFDHWLAERPDTILPPARVTSFGDRAGTDARGRWEGFDQWPPAEAEVERLYPTAEGGLVTAPPSGGRTEYFINAYDGPSACVIGCLPTDAAHAQTMSEIDSRNPLGRFTMGRTTFTAPPFAEDTEIAGPVTFRLRAALTADDTYFVSKLEVVTAEGKVLRLETGHRRAQTSASLTELVPVVPGDVNDYRIDLGHIHYVFQAGQSLRITLSGGDVPFVVPDCPSGLVTVEHGEGTYVEFPVVRS